MRCCICIWESSDATSVDDGEAEADVEIADTDAEAVRSSVVVTAVLMSCFGLGGILRALGSLTVVWESVAADDSERAFACIW